MSKIKEAECCDIQSVKIQKNLNEIKDGITFNLHIKKTKNVTLSNKCVPEINDDDDNYEVKIDLSNLKYNNEEIIKVSFNPNKTDPDDYTFKLRIKQDNNDISNESELELKITQVGDNDDLLY